MNLNEKIKEIQSKKSHPIIFIAGMGGSGKTTFAKKLVAENINAIHFELDWYHVYASKERHKRIQEAFDSKDQKRIDSEADPIYWYDFDAFKNAITTLQREGKLHVNNAWEQKTGEKIAEHDLDFKGKDGLIVCDGDDLIHSEIISLADLSILLDVSPDEARHRAEERDKHRADTAHLARKRLIMETYDIPYFAENKKNVDMVLETY